MEEREKTALTHVTVGYGSLIRIKGVTEKWRKNIALDARAWQISRAAGETRA